MTRFLLPLSIALAVAGASTAPAQHAHHVHPTVEIVAPWARASAGATRTGAVYMTIRNTAANVDRLIGVSTPVADRVELHTHVAEGDVMKMRKIDGVDLKSNAAVELKPGGLHVMLFDLKAPLGEGQRFPLTLGFEKAGEVSVQVEVRSTAATGPASSSAHHRH
jgi:copper(I)-binding protein